jgi:hypothetical protein
MLTQRFSSFNGNNISPWCHQTTSTAPRSESKHNVPGRRSSGGRSLMRREMKLANVNVLHDDLDAHILNYPKPSFPTTRVAVGGADQVNEEIRAPATR